MLEAATITASISAGVMPAVSIAWFAAKQAISHITDESVLGRSGMSGTILCGSRMPALLIT